MLSLKSEKTGFGGWFSLESQRERTLRMWDNEIPVVVEQAECHVHEVRGCPRPTRGCETEVGKIAESNYRAP